MTTAEIVEKFIEDNRPLLRKIRRSKNKPRGWYWQMKQRQFNGLADYS